MRHMPRYAGKRDSNEEPLVQLAETLGWWMHKSQEIGDWTGWRRGQWHVIEIKNPDQQGHADEFTPKQRLLHAEAHKRGARILVWRTKDDVFRDSNARATA